MQASFVLLPYTIPILIMCAVCTSIIGIGEFSADSHGIYVIASLIIADQLCLATLKNLSEPLHNSNLVAVTSTGKQAFLDNRPRGVLCMSNEFEKR